MQILQIITDTNITDIENKIPCITCLVTSTALDTNTTDTTWYYLIITDITNLASKSAISRKATRIEDEMFDITNLVAKASLNI